MAKQGKYVYEWPRPMVTVDSMIFSVMDEKKTVLLIKRGRDPYKGLWALPGGFLEMDEELEDGAARELYEETGLAGMKLRQFRTFGQIGRDPRGRLIGTVYIGIVNSQPAVKGGDDADDARWFDINELPELAFDHDQVIKMGISCLDKQLD